MNKVVYLGNRTMFGSVGVKSEERDEEGGCGGIV